jgi:TPR repeat protein
MPAANQPAPPPEQTAAPTRIAAPSAVVPQPPVVAERAAPPAPPAMAPPAVSLEREEIAALYRRGEQLVTQGEIAAARLVFTRAAEAGDARSALALGASYDPEVLRKLGVLGVVGDAALAREWYTKASGLGSSEAAQRIELMARGP